MKSLSIYIGAFLTVSCLFSACDVINNPIPEKDPYQPLSDSLALDSVETARGFTTPVQKVLLEDYTGHTCGNCPDAAVEARKLKTQYGNKVVVMAVHAGFFAKVKSADPSVNPKGMYTYNFATTAGEEWALSFKIEANPNGMVNRTPAGTSTAFYQPVASWSSSVAAHLANSPKAGLTVTPLYNESTRTLNIKVRSEYLANLSGNYNLGVFITEDSIVNWQKNYKTSPQDIEKYVHPHALRAAVDGTWGHLNKANPVTGNVENRYFAYNLDPSWKEKNCSVVAYLFNATTKEVLQVEEVHLH